ncbi:MAG: hypothetical protein WCS15_05120 [Prevotella sp.]|nr:hypothetical protein [Prevotella sp.]
MKTYLRKEARRHGSSLQITDLKIREDMSRLQERENKAFSDYVESIEEQAASTF